MSAIGSFVADGFRELFRGGARYWAWIVGLLAVAAAGAVAYAIQLGRGLIVTGLSDQVSWGVYIANFTFLEAVAAAAVMLVIPAYVFHRDELQPLVVPVQGIAVAAAVAAMLFVTVDLGRPERMWHMIPGLGRLNFPASLMAWDVVMLAVYVAITGSIPLYVLYRTYRGEEPRLATYYPGILVSIAWSIGILTVTAFLFSSNVGRPFWNTAVMGPRFVASAFTGGTALLILSLEAIGRVSRMPIERRVLDLLALILAVSVQVNLFLIGAELFTDFYNRAEHSVSARYLYFGQGGYRALVPWIWSALGLLVVAVVILTVHPLRGRPGLLRLACVMAVVGIWIDKAMGLVVPGFIPTPLGEVFDYTPSRTEALVSAGIWAVGLLIVTALLKVAIPVQRGTLRWAGARGASANPALDPSPGGPA